MKQKQAFTLTELLLAILIVGTIAVIVLPPVITRFQNNIFEHSYKREIQSISELADKLAVDENKSDFHSTSMYLDSEPESYDESSGAFLKKYFKVSKYCGDTKTNCFSSKYYEYENRVRKEYTLETKGSCAILKNGMSICISPQIGETAIQGWIDLNGKKGPNILKRDLRSFIIDLQKKGSLDKRTKPVITYCNDPNHPEHKDETVCTGQKNEDEKPKPDNPSCDINVPVDRDTCDKFISENCWDTLSYDTKDACCANYGFYMSNQSKSICTRNAESKFLKISIVNNNGENLYGACFNTYDSVHGRYVPDPGGCYYKVERSGNIRDSIPLSVELGCCNGSCPERIWQKAYNGSSVHISLSTAGSCMTGRCKVEGREISCNYSWEEYSNYRAVRQN